MTIAGAIFDVDGIIVDTVPLHFKAWKKMFEEYGHDFTMEDYLAKVDGRPRDEGAAAILGELTPEDVHAAGAVKQAHYLRLLDSEPLETFDSTINLIHEMKGWGLKLAAASSSKNARHLLAKIDLLKFFDANVSGGDFEKGKPDPEIFLTAARRIGLQPGECVVFEDANSGVEAARRGGFLCVAVNRHDNAAALSSADIIVNDLAEISLAEILKLKRKQ